MSTVLMGTVDVDAPTIANRRPVLVSTAGRLSVDVNSMPATGGAVGATGAAVPASADYEGINVGGLLRGVTGVNPSGTVFAPQMDIASVAGTTATGGAGAVTAGTLRITQASDSPEIAVLGVTTGAKVITDANGTIQQYLRGLVTMVLSFTNTVANGTAATAAWLTGLVYNTTQPTLTNGQGAALQGDARANLMVNVATKLDPTNDQIGAMAVMNGQAVTLTTSGANYVAGDVVDGIKSLTTVNYASGKRVKLKTLCFKDKAAVAPALHIYFFKATPSGGTYSDNTALVWGSGDFANLVGSLNIAASDWITDISASVVTFSALDMDMAVSATTLFMLVIAEGAYTLTDGNYTMELGFEQEN